MCAVGRSPPTTCPLWSISRSKAPRAVSLLASVAQPVFKIAIRQRSFLVARFGKSARVGVRDPPLARAGTILGNCKPEQTHGGLADDFFALEQHGAKRRLGLILALVGGQPEPLYCLPRVLRATLALEKEPSQVVLGVRIAEIGRGVGKHLARAVWIGLHRGLRNPLEVDLTERHEGISDKTGLRRSRRIVCVPL